MAALLAAYLCMFGIIIFSILGLVPVEDALLLQRASACLAVLTTGILVFLMPTEAHEILTKGPNDRVGEIAACLDLAIAASRNRAPRFVVYAIQLGDRIALDGPSNHSLSYGDLPCATGALPHVYGEAVFVERLDHQRLIVAIPATAAAFSPETDATARHEAARSLLLREGIDYERPPAVGMAVYPENGLCGPDLLVHALARLQVDLAARTDASRSMARFSIVQADGTFTPVRSSDLHGRLMTRTDR